MSRSHKSISLLKPLAAQTDLIDAILNGSEAYGNAFYVQQNSILPYQSGYGITCHSEFNRLFADTLWRNQRRSKIQFRASKEEDSISVGDVMFDNFVAFDPIKGQSRFDAKLQGTAYNFLHLTGVTDDEQLRLAISSMGKMRQDYFKQQSSRVVRPLLPSLFGHNPNDLAMPIEDGRPNRVLIINQLAGPRKSILRTFLAVPTRIFDQKSGWVNLAELLELDERIIQPKTADVPMSRNDNGNDYGFSITRRTG